MNAIQLRSVLIADDHTILAQGLVATLGKHFRVTGTVTSLDALRPAPVTHDPEVWCSTSPSWEPPRSGCSPSSPPTRRSAYGS